VTVSWNDIYKTIVFSLYFAGSQITRSDRLKIQITSEKKDHDLLAITVSKKEPDNNRISKFFLFLYIDNIFLSEDIIKSTSDSSKKPQPVPDNPSSDPIKSVPDDLKARSIHPATLPHKTDRFKERALILWIDLACQITEREYFRNITHPHYQYPGTQHYFNTEIISSKEPPSQPISSEKRV